MSFSSRYRSKTPGQDGRIAYSGEEVDVWRTLFDRQASFLPGRAVSAFLPCVQRLGLEARAVPQVPDLTARLRAATGFEALAVPAMIEAGAFFDLLARRAFPMATFVRSKDELDYVTEPDLFHEAFGHGPLLLEPDYADVVEAFGRLAQALGPAHYEALQRLFWFTIEFGLMKGADGTLEVLGAGLLSSPQEARAAVEDQEVERLGFDLDLVLSTDYRIDRMQPRYFVLENLAQLRQALEVMGQGHGSIRRAS